MVPHFGHTELMVVVVRAGDLYEDIDQIQRRKTIEYALSHGVLLLLDITSLVLTFAGLHAVKPPVIYVFVCSISAVLVPSTTRSATTDSAGFLEHATLWTRHPTHPTGDH